MRREPQNSSLRVPRFQSEGGMLTHTGGTCSHSGYDGLSETSDIGNAS